MPHCAALGCSNSSRKVFEDKVSFFRFPYTDPGLLRRWCLNIGRKSWWPSRFSRLCSDHFTPDCFEAKFYDDRIRAIDEKDPVKYPSSKTLKRGSVPTLFLKAHARAVDHRHRERPLRECVPSKGVNAEVARAMDSELGIRDYGVLRACVGDGLVRAELLATARDRLPFGFYAVLRQVVKALQGAEPHDAGTPRWDDDATAVSSGDVTLGGLVDVLLALFSSLSRDLLLCAQKLRAMDDQQDKADSPSSAGAKSPEDIPEMDQCNENDEPEVSSAPSMEDIKINFTSDQIKMEPFEESVAEFSDAVLLPQPSEREPAEHTSSEPLGLLDESPELIISNLTSMPDTRTNLTCTADTRPYPWPYPSLGETNSEEDTTATTSITINTSQPVTQQQRLFVLSDPIRRTVLANHSQKPFADESEMYGFQLAKSDLERPRLESTGEKPYRCEVCGQTYSQICGLKRHLRMHTGEKLHRCEVCGRGFPQSSSLKVHLRTHTGEKPFHCDVCGMRFSQKSHVKTHQRKHMGDTI
ncbi:zinc finger and SCAN domain-containing protein 31-like isoform X2 [Lethenteron reissneri]|uniref:zinc finger and SCAN domain-containing protein 31-like isoform X2 n=1 Tax=Lethenteron reissneri TaxID=7753 RepID=UPI002AB78CF2|nr:zinc finger and SCAN domain-containing protein 31-like isoform X2 [Lethenteron reissneri]